MIRRTFFLIASTACLALAGCAAGTPRKTQEKPAPTAKTDHRVGQTRTVRTTAYTHTEPGGSRNAIGGRLSNGPVKSAASDWSRFPLGTKFLILKTGETRIIDDYGSALVGTDTIDLYKPTRATMRKWGVRHIDIKILEWGSPRRSLEVLSPRQRNKHVRRMVESLRAQAEGMPKEFRKLPTNGGTPQKPTPAPPRLRSR